VGERRRGVHESAVAHSSDFRTALGPVYVSPDEARQPLRIVDPQRLLTLSAWIDSLVPGDANWPRATQTDAIGYMDAVAHASPPLRPILLHGIDRLDALASEGLGRGTSFLACSDNARYEILSAFEQLNPDGAFDLVLELTLEAYYRDEAVLEALEERTGFSMRRATEGWEMEPFDESTLDRVRAMPTRYRMPDTR
jgi:hypothetical protein